MRNETFCQYVKRRRAWRLVRIFELHQQAIATGDRTSLRMVRRLADSWGIVIDAGGGHGKKKRKATA